MTAELLMAIAQLCMIHSGIGTDSRQLKCQQGYIQCLKMGTVIGDASRLMFCVLEKN